MDRLYEYFRNNSLEPQKTCFGSRLHTPALQPVWRRHRRAGPQRQDILFPGLRGPAPRGIAIYFLVYPSLYRRDRLPRSGHAPASIRSKRVWDFQSENLGSILEIDDFDKLIAKSTTVFSDKTTVNAGYLFNDERKTKHAWRSPRGRPAVFLPQQSRARSNSVHGLSSTCSPAIGPRTVFSTLDKELFA